MCGYCIENNTFIMIARAQSGQFAYADLHSNYILTIGYLQECPDILSALAATPTDVATDDLLQSILACRGLEILMSQGFASAAYQSLLKTQAYVAAIEAFTAEAEQKNHRPDDARFDISAASWTEDKRTYIEAGYLDAQLRQWSLRDAQTMLKQYVDFRLNGIGLHRNDLDELFRQTGVMDPIDDICAEDRHAFAAHFPAFWGALQWLGRHQVGASDIWEVVTKNPIGVPDFEGLELWFQRRAALLTYEQFGIAPFLKDLTLVRADLFQYINLMRPISREDQTSLLNALNQLEVADHVGANFSLRLWLEKDDLQVS